MMTTTAPAPVTIDVIGRGIRAVRCRPSRCAVTEARCRPRARPYTGVLVTGARCPVAGCVRCERGGRSSEEVFVWIVQARVAAHNRELSAARDALARAQPLRPLMPMPVFAVQNRIELAHAYLALNEMNSARTVMHEAGEIIQ